MRNRSLKEKWREESLLREEKVLHVCWIYSSGWVEILSSMRERTTWNGSMDWHKAEGWAGLWRNEKESRQRGGIPYFGPICFKRWADDVGADWDCFVFVFNVFWGKSTSLVKSNVKLGVCKGRSSTGFASKHQHRDKEIKFSNTETPLTQMDAFHTHSLFFCQQLGSI